MPVALLARPNPLQTLDVVPEGCWYGKCALRVPGKQGMDFQNTAVVAVRKAMFVRRSSVCMLLYVWVTSSSLESANTS